MYDSKITLKSLIDELKDEVDIAIEIPNKSYVLWFNALEQLLYSEYIKEQRKAEITAGEETVFIPEDIPVEDGTDNIRFEDIAAVFADGVQLIKTNEISLNIFPNTYCGESSVVGKKLKINTARKPKNIEIFYYVRPTLKTVNEDDEIGNGNVCIPIEFLDLCKAKLRGEAYKLANEEALAAKWINDYNVLLETFKIWLQSKQAGFGL